MVDGVICCGSTRALGKDTRTKRCVPCLRKARRVAITLMARHAFHTRRRMWRLCAYVRRELGVRPERCRKSLVTRRGHRQVAGRASARVRCMDGHDIRHCERSRQGDERSREDGAAHRSRVSPEQTRCDSCGVRLTGRACSFRTPGPRAGLRRLAAVAGLRARTHARNDDLTLQFDEVTTSAIDLGARTCKHPQRCER